MKVSDAFLNRDGRLRNGWWVVTFLALLAALLFPTLLVSINFNHELSMWEQAALILIATIAVQALRKRPLAEVTGSPGWRTFTNIGSGTVWGFTLMAVPAALMVSVGWVRLSAGAANSQTLASTVALMAGVAVAEELLFRGVLFQRLIAGIGLWPAQIAVGLLFVLTHMNNPGLDGAVRIWAGINIFLASVLFGEAFIRTKGLAMPIALHFMANTTQGALLGFGVSGNSEPGILSPTFAIDSDWLTGGPFGLEASLPGSLTLTIILGWFVWSRRPSNNLRRRVLDANQRTST